MTPEHLKQLRESLGMTLDDVAAYLGLRHRSQASHLETGRTAIRGAKLRMLQQLEASEGKSFLRKRP